MQDFEVPRWAAAKAAFAEAFTRGYQHAKAELASGQEKQDGNALQVFYVDVLRDAILDDEWQPYVSLFRDAGRAAALAKRRGDSVSMLDVKHDPDHREASISGKCRWVVMLERPDIALPR
jgi:hypothetical protein